jgi:hypothetical protein
MDSRPAADLCASRHRKQECAHMCKHITVAWTVQYDNPVNSTIDSDNRQ